MPIQTEGKRVDPELPLETAFPDQRWEGFPHRLDCGVYWMSARNGGARTTGAGGDDAPGGRRRFDPGRPSVLYVHGLAPTTVSRGFRETFNWGQQPGQPIPPEFDLNTAEAWVVAGYNVGVFYWNQLADEVDVRRAEAKIWTADGPAGMRWLRERPEDGLIEYRDDGAPTECVGALLAAELRAAFGDADASSPGYRLVGHSLGAQLAVAAAHRLLDEGECKLPSRIVFVDPYASPGGRSFHGGRSCGDVMCGLVRELRGRGTVFEHVRTSKLGALPVCDLGEGLGPGGGLTAYVELSPPGIPWWDVRGGHIAAPALYFLSFEIAGALQQQRQRRAEGGGWEWEWSTFSGLAAAPDDAIRRLSELPYGFCQRGSRFERVPKRGGGGDDTRPEPPVRA